MKAILNIINKFLAGMRIFEKVVASTIFLAMFILFVVQIIARYFFTPIASLQEWIQLTFLWLMIFGTCYADQTSENIQFTSVYEMLGPNGKLICETVGALAVVVTTAVMFPSAITYIEFRYGIKCASLPLSYGQAYTPFLYLLVAFFVKYLVRFVKCINTIVCKFNKGGAAA